MWIMKASTYCNAMGKPCLSMSQPAVFTRRGCVSKANVDAPGKAILGVGGNVVDQFFKVKAVPKPGEKGYFASPHKVHESSVVGGVTLNHLSWASLLGAPCGLLALQGCDPVSLLIRKTMKEMHVSTDHVTVDDMFTAGQSYVFVQEDGERSIIQATGATSLVNREAVQKYFGERIRSHARMLTSEICHAPLSGVAEALRIARSANITTALDLDVSPNVAVNEAQLGSLDELHECISLADILKPSKHAAAELVSLARPDLTSTLSSVDIAKYLKEHYGSQMVAMTNGNQPSVVLCKDKVLEIPTEPLDHVTDATGAGDAFFGGLIAYLFFNGFPTSEDEMWSLGTLANKTGRTCCSVFGALPDDSSRETLLKEAASYPIRQLQHSPDQSPASTPTFQQSFALDANALTASLDSLDATAIGAFVDAVHECKGNIFLSGVGKSGIVALRMAASLSSLGMPCHFVHAAEWEHGDLGKARPNDVAIFISHSGGKLNGVQNIIALLKERQLKILAMTSSSSSQLASESDFCIAYADGQSLNEPLGGVPTSSVVLQEATVNGIVHELIHRRRLTTEDFVSNHPGGSLGYRLKETKD